MAEASSYYAHINRLFRFLTEETGGYTFVSADDQRFISLVNEELLRRGKEQGKSFQTIFLRADTDTPLLAQLNEAADAGAAALIIPNLDTLIHLQGTQVLSSLNFSREALNQLGVPLLFWASKHTLHQLGNQAADFFSQRAASTAFIEGQAPNSAEGLFETYQPERFRDADVEAAKLKIGLLEQQLQEAESIGYAPARIARDIALPLAEAYAAIGALTHIPLLRDRYWAQLPSQPAYLIRTGELAFQMGENVKAATDFEHARMDSRTSGDKTTEIQASLLLSEVYKRVGRLGEGLTLLEEALRLARAIGDKSGEGATLNNISNIYSARGDYATALTYLEQSLAIRRAIGDTSSEGTTLNNISQIYDARGDYATALSYLEQSLAIRREIGDKSGEAITLHNMGAIAYEQGDEEQFFTFELKAWKLSQEIGSAQGILLVGSYLGDVLLQSGKPAQSIPYLQAAYRIARDGNLPDAEELAETLRKLDAWPED